MPIPLKYFKTEHKSDPFDKHKHHFKIFYLDEFGGVHIRSVEQHDSTWRDTKLDRHE